MESETLYQVEPDCLLATGGGVVERIQNREFLKQSENLVIWLDISWENLISRIRNSDRPLVKAQNEYELFSLWEKRKGFYQECADIVIPDPDLNKLVEVIQG